MADTAQSPAAHRDIWRLDPSHVEVRFTVWRMMIATVEGRFTGVRGDVSVQDGDLTTAQVELTVDVATVDTREPKRDEHLRSADFFDAEHYPMMTFKSRRVDVLHGGGHKLVGDLTVRGVTREVALDVESEPAAGDPWSKARAGFRATGALSRRDFGLTWNQVLDAGGVLVGDEVRIAIAAELIRAGAPAE